MTTRHLPNLNETVLNGLDFFTNNQPARLAFPSGARLVVGSVNAYHTGRMLFNGQAAIFADEGNFREILRTYRAWIKKKIIKEAIIISASGEKDSIWEIQAAKAAGLKTWLLTCNAASTSSQFADKTTVSPKIPEPYSIITPLISAYCFL